MFFKSDEEIHSKIAKIESLVHQLSKDSDSSDFLNADLAVNHLAMRIVADGYKDKPAIQNKLNQIISTFESKKEQFLGAHVTPGKKL